MAKIPQFNYKLNQSKLVKSGTGLEFKPRSPWKDNQRSTTYGIMNCNVCVTLVPEVSGEHLQITQAIQLEWT